MYEWLVRDVATGEVYLVTTARNSLDAVANQYAKDVLGRCDDATAESVLGRTDVSPLVRGVRSGTRRVLRPAEHLETCKKG